MSHASLPAMPTFDILGFGVTVIDHLLYVESYPPADTKMQIRWQQRRLGGLTAVALAAASRLGCTTAYAGMLGDDPLSREVAQVLSEQGINLSHIVRREDARPLEATVIVASHPPTRTILFDASHPCGADPAEPAEALIRSARVIFVDNFGIEGMLRAARIARSANIPVVADFEASNSPAFPELLSLVDHLIIPNELATQLTGESSPAEAVQRLWTDTRELVAVTCGRDGAWYRTRTESGESTVCHQPAFQVETIDSTGCGDVFHGAYTAALIWGLRAEERIRIAAAAAAIKASRSNGVAGLPTKVELEAFLRERA